MSNLFNPRAVIGAQGGGVQDDQHSGGLGVVHDDTCGLGGIREGGRAMLEGANRMKEHMLDYTMIGWLVDKNEMVKF